MRHKKKLLSVIFLQALDSWRSGQSQPHLIGLVFLCHNIFLFFAHPAQKKRRRRAVFLSPFLVWLSQACQTAYGYVHGALI